MGIPGAGKSRVAEELAASGYLRLNRDERGGSLRELAVALDEALLTGTRQVVLDNTYLTRAARRDVVDAAARHGAAVRCIWLDTPLAQAQINMVERVLDQLGSLPEPGDLRGLARSDPGLLSPTSQMRAVRELEPPGDDEGFSHVERRAFRRFEDPGLTRAGVFVAAAAVDRERWHGDAAEAVPHALYLVFDWNPDGDRTLLDRAAGRLAEVAAGPVEMALCPHQAGPPQCWCRPPLPGLVLAFARAHRVDPASSLVVGTGPAHRTLATALGARYLPVG